MITFMLPKIWSIGHTVDSQTWTSPFTSLELGRFSSSVSFLAVTLNNQILPQMRFDYSDLLIHLHDFFLQFHSTSTSTSWSCPSTTDSDPTEISASRLETCANIPSPCQIACTTRITRPTYQRGWFTVHTRDINNYACMSSTRLLHIKVKYFIYCQPTSLSLTVWNAFDLAWLYHA